MIRVAVIGLIVLLQVPFGFAAPVQTLLQDAGFQPTETAQPVPDFQLHDLDGQTYNSQALRGKVVFLNFWATWCAPCRLEMPEMEHLFQAFRKRPFTMLAVAMQQRREQVAPFFKELNLRYTALLDIEGEVSQRFAVRGLPTTLLIDCSGHLIGKVTGPRPWNSPAVHRLMRVLLQDAQCH
jgi:peroxiredoxin